VRYWLWKEVERASNKGCCWEAFAIGIVDAARLRSWNPLSFDTTTPVHVETG
jgi:hypothetical protein